MPIPIAEWIAQIDAELAAMAPKHEGMRDYARLNLKPEAAAAVNETVRAYDRSTTRLTALRTALDALAQEGYPTLQVREISVEAKADLDENARSIQVALAEFITPAPATTLGLQAGQIEPK